MFVLVFVIVCLCLLYRLATKIHILLILTYWLSWFYHIRNVSELMVQFLFPMLVWSVCEYNSDHVISLDLYWPAEWCTLLQAWPCRNLTRPSIWRWPLLPGNNQVYLVFKWQMLTFTCLLAKSNITTWLIDTRLNKGADRRYRCWELFDQCCALFHCTHLSTCAQTNRPLAIGLLLRRMCQSVMSVSHRQVSNRPYAFPRSNK